MQRKTATNLALIALVGASPWLVGAVAGIPLPVPLGEVCDGPVEISGVRVHYGPDPFPSPPGHGCRENKAIETSVDRHFPFVETARVGQTINIPVGMYAIAYAINPHPRRHMPDGILGGEQVFYPDGAALVASHSILEMTE